MTLFLKVGATEPWDFTLFDSRGVIDLTNADTVKLSLTLKGDATLKISNGACTIVEALNGRVRYPPTVGDVDTSGAYDAMFTINWLDGTKTKLPARDEEDFFPIEIQMAKE